MGSSVGSPDRWFASIRNRAAVIRAYKQGEPWSSRPTADEASRKILFGQTATSLRPSTEN